MRQRALKPEHLFRDEKFAQFSFGTRWLFIALLCCADREGRLRDNPILILADAFPFERETLTVDQVEEMLMELHDRGFIVRYSINGKNFIQIANFLNLEKPHVNEARSDIPDPGVYGAQLKPRPTPLAPMAETTCSNGGSRLLLENSPPSGSGSGSGSFSDSESESGSRESDCVSEERAALALPSAALPRSELSPEDRALAEEAARRAAAKNRTPLGGKRGTPHCVADLVAATRMPR
ncbi:MAG: hypothetical protein ACLQBJ_18835 [Bryobacteraceae bacterium]